MRFLFNGRPVDFRPEDSVLTALVRHGVHPCGGGTLCFGGDCPHCVATVDGVSYVRTCQLRAVPGSIVNSHPRDSAPPLPGPTTTSQVEEIEHRFCDVAVVCFGPSPEARQEEERARESGKDVRLICSSNDEHVVGLYAGPLLVVRTGVGILHLRVEEEVVVATGSAELLPVVKGGGLSGLYTSRAVESLFRSGVDLGKVVAVGRQPKGVDCCLLQGELLELKGEGAKVVAAVTRIADGRTQETPCDAVAFGLGVHPRDQLLLMGQDLSIPVRGVGETLAEETIPECPGEGVVCPCSGVTMADLDHTWESGFREMELIKRSTLAGTGTCQGMGCLPYLKSFLREKGGELQPRFTARPVVRQVTLGQIAAGAHFPPDLRTALHQEHLRLGAVMERSGPWLRPWSYGNLESEYWAARLGVSIMDVGTLGKMEISGPDANSFLQRIYPADLSTLRAGRCRYVLLLDERGYVMDDGIVAKHDDTRFSLTFTSSGASAAEMWLRDWAFAFGANVRLMNQTYSRGAVNVTGPYSRQLMERLGLTEPLNFMNFADQKIGGVSCRVYRLSFTGELSYELHHCVSDSLILWRALMNEGREFGIKPHGLETLNLLRLEKGHIIVHQDTDFDSTPRRLRHQWMVGSAKSDFLGRQALLRSDSFLPDKALVGFVVEGEPPFEGATITYQGKYAGFVTSSGYSFSLQQNLALGHLHYSNGELPPVVSIDGLRAVRTELPFYDKEGARARV